jgi:SET domain-containing protein
MLLIRTRVAPSRIHGLGLFTVHAVPAGTPVWRLVPGFDRVYRAAEVAAWPAPAREFVEWFGYRRAEDGAWVLSGDHACFMNHAVSPNTGTPPGQPGALVTVALRDLAAGEELTCDYFAFDAEAARKLGRPAPPAA